MVILTLLMVCACLSAAHIDERHERQGGESMSGGMRSRMSSTMNSLCVTAKDERDQSPRRWMNVKQRLAFCRIMQDGDDEGCLHLYRLPTPAEVVQIREALGIRKRRALTEDGRAQSNSPSNPSFIEQNNRAATPPRETA
jgi:hypothetical protein